MWEAVVGRERWETFLPQTSLFSATLLNHTSTHALCRIKADMAWAHLISAHAAPLCLCFSPHLSRNEIASLGISDGMEINGDFHAIWAPSPPCKVKLLHLGIIVCVELQFPFSTLSRFLGESIKVRSDFKHFNAWKSYWSWGLEWSYSSIFQSQYIAVILMNGLLINNRVLWYNFQHKKTRY